MYCIRLYGRDAQGAKTATSRREHGFAGEQEHLFSIWAAHRPAYLATIIGTEQLDCTRKVEKAQQLKGPKLFIAFSPCPTGSECVVKDSVDFGKSEYGLSRSKWRRK